MLEQFNRNKLDLIIIKELDKDLIDTKAKWKFKEAIEAKHNVKIVNTFIVGFKF